MFKGSRVHGERMPSLFGADIRQVRGGLETDIQEKDEKSSQKQQNLARNGKAKVKSKPKSAKVNQMVNPRKVKVKPDA
ncbi:hypothetical protein Tco_0391407, partial [Tanacetum coccineum]